MKLMFRAFSILSALTALVLGCVVIHQHHIIDQLDSDLQLETSRVLTKELSASFCRDSVRTLPVGTYEAENGDKIIVEPMDSWGEDDSVWNIAMFHYGPDHRDIRYLSMIEVQLLYAMPGWPQSEAEYYAQFQPPPPRMIGG